MTLASCFNASHIVADAIGGNATWVSAGQLFIAHNDDEADTRRQSGRGVQRVVTCLSKKYIETVSVRILWGPYE
jgi:hypothetical protein